MPKRFSQQTKEKARSMRASGMTYVDIAKEVGCTAPCVRYWCDWRARAENHQRMTVKSHCRSRRMDVAEEHSEIIIALYSFINQWNEENDTDYEMDHIIPCHAGGSHTIENLRIVPRRLNRTGRPKRKSEI